MSPETEQAEAAAFCRKVGAWRGEGSEVLALSGWGSPWRASHCPLHGLEGRTSVGGLMLYLAVAFGVQGSVLHSSNLPHPQKHSGKIQSTKDSSMPMNSSM